MESNEEITPDYKFYYFVWTDGEIDANAVVRHDGEFNLVGTHRQLRGIVGNPVIVSFYAEISEKVFKEFRKEFPETQATGTFKGTKH